MGRNCCSLSAPRRLRPHSGQAVRTRRRRIVHAGLRACQVVSRRAFRARFRCRGHRYARRRAARHLRGAGPTRAGALCAGKHNANRTERGRWRGLIAVSRRRFCACALLAATAAPARPHRHTVVGHFMVPKQKARRSPNYSANVITNPGFESGNIDGGWHQCGDMRAYVTRVIRSPALTTSIREPQTAAANPCETPASAKR